MTLDWCAGQEAAQTVTESTAAPAAAHKLADILQEQAGDEQAAPTQLAANSTAGTAAFSSGSGGGRYQPVPPSSLWGPPAEVTTSTAAAVETEAAGQPASGVDRTVEADMADVDETSVAASGADEAPDRPDIHGMREPVSAGAEEHLPAGTNSPDTVVPSVSSSAEAAPADSSSAEYHAASTVHNASAGQVKEDAGTVEEEQRAVTTEEDESQQPGVFTRRTHTGHLCWRLIIRETVCLQTYAEC